MGKLECAVYPPDDVGYIERMLELRSSVAWREFRISRPIVIPWHGVAGVVSVHHCTLRCSGQILANRDHIFTVRPIWDSFPAAKHNLQELLATNRILFDE